MTRRPIAFGLVLALVLLGAAFALKTAEHRGLLAPETTTRIVEIAIGLGLAVYGNLIPKSLESWRGEAAARRTQAAARVGGWAFALAGLAYAGLWAFTPSSFAGDASMVAVGSATALTLAYVLWCVMGRSGGAEDRAI